MHAHHAWKKYPLRGYFHASPSKKYPLCGDIFEQMGQIISIFEDICPKWEIICRYQPMKFNLFLTIFCIFRLFLGILCSNHAIFGEIRQFLVDHHAWNAIYFAPFRAIFSQNQGFRAYFWQNMLIFGEFLGFQTNYCRPCITNLHPKYVFSGK